MYEEVTAKVDNIEVLSNNRKRVWVHYKDIKVPVMIGIEPDTHVSIGDSVRLRYLQEQKRDNQLVGLSCVYFVANLGTNIVEV